MPRKITRENYPIIKQHAETHRKAQTIQAFGISDATVSTIKKSTSFDDYVTIVANYHATHLNNVRTGKVVRRGPVKNKPSAYKKPVVTNSYIKHEVLPSPFTDQTVAKSSEPVYVSTTINSYPSNKPMRKKAAKGRIQVNFTDAQWEKALNVLRNGATMMEAYEILGFKGPNNARRAINKDGKLKMAFRLAYEEGEPKRADVRSQRLSNSANTRWEKHFEEKQKAFEKQTQEKVIYLQKPTTTPAPAPEKKEEQSPVECKITPVPLPYSDKDYNRFMKAITAIASLSVVLLILLIATVVLSLAQETFLK